MPPNSTKKAISCDPHGMFSGVIVFFVEMGVQVRRIQIWKQRLVQMGAVIQDRLTKSITHVFAKDLSSALEKLGQETLSRFRGKVLSYQWIEDSLKMGEKVLEDSYSLRMQTDTSVTRQAAESNPLQQNQENLRFSDDDTFPAKKSKPCPEEASDILSCKAPEYHQIDSSPCTSSGSLSHRDLSSHGPDAVSDTSLVYNPPDLNRNVTEIFAKLMDIYRAMGDDRRSFSYYKAIPVIEKLPFKIESREQVRNLPGIGKSLQDHIQEIVNTGKLSKLENFQKDEKVRTISLFADVWGIGPATALKLYEKGHRTLDDLKAEESLTNAQRLGLKYFEDIKTRIPRHEVEEMEGILKKVGEEILPGVAIVCGGSYRRGKASCGDMDIVITHPDGKSHIGFLPKFVKRLKEVNFLREHLVFSVHSVEGTDSGVDTYFGLCTYPGQELRHRIDFKVYPRDIYAFGLIAWTGNDVLNRRLRLLAESKGFKLDDTGIFPTVGNVRTGISSLKFESEKQVFDFLGVPWLEPHQRNL